MSQVQPELGEGGSHAGPDGLDRYLLPQSLSQGLGSQPLDPTLPSFLTRNPQILNPVLDHNLQNAAFVGASMGARVAIAHLQPYGSSTPKHPSLNKKEHEDSKAKRRGPMDEMRQLVRIMVKFLPQSIKNLTTSDEPGGGNRVTEPQIKSYLKRTLGDHAPQPVWGMPNGWGAYMADLFTWALGREVTDEEARSCACRQQGRSWQVKEARLAELGIFAYAWPLPLDREGIRKAQENPGPPPAGFIGPPEGWPNVELPYLKSRSHPGQALGTDKTTSDPDEPPVTYQARATVRTPHWTAKDLDKLTEKQCLDALLPLLMAAESKAASRGLAAPPSGDDVVTLWDKVRSIATSRSQAYFAVQELAAVEAATARPGTDSTTPTVLKQRANIYAAMNTNQAASPRMGFTSMVPVQPMLPMSQLLTSMPPQQPAHPASTAAAPAQSKAQPKGQPKLVFKPARQPIGISRDAGKRQQGFDALINAVDVVENMAAERTESDDMDDDDDEPSSDSPVYRPRSKRSRAPAADTYSSYGTGADPSAAWQHLPQVKVQRVMRGPGMLVAGGSHLGRQVGSPAHNGGALGISRDAGNGSMHVHDAPPSHWTMSPLSKSGAVKPSLASPAKGATTTTTTTASDNSNLSNTAAPPPAVRSSTVASLRSVVDAMLARPLPVIDEKPHKDKGGRGDGTWDGGSPGPGGDPPGSASAKAHKARHHLFEMMDGAQDSPGGSSQGMLGDPGIIKPIPVTRPLRVPSPGVG